MRITLSTPVSAFPRIGPKTAKLFQSLGVTNTKDLLYTFPARYEDFRSISSIAKVQGNAYACVKGKIRLLAARRSPRKWMRFTEGLLEDTSGSIKVIWFNQPYIAKSLSEGDEVFVAGRVDVGKYGMQFVNPVFEKTSNDPTHTARIVPVYPSTRNLTQKMIRALAKTVLPLADKIPDPIPETIRKQFSLMPLSAALKIVHFPVTLQHATQARNRIAIQELIELLQSFKDAYVNRKKERGLIYKDAQQLFTHYIRKLPFSLTKSQKAACDDMIKDLGQTFPMKRLLNGDVGSGKTILAHLAVLTVVSHHQQAALLAPTDILAQQHFESFKKIFANTSIAWAVFTRTTRTLYTKGKEVKLSKKEMLEKLQDGTISYCIGTHAVIQKEVHWNDLALVIVDEQHRFGVNQRGTLLQATRGLTPHYLSLTATPIPRSLGRLLFTGADVSLLTEKPGNRKPIETKILHEKERVVAYTHIKKSVQRGEQAFVICPIIEESDTLGVKAATAAYKDLSERVFPDLSVGLIHGKLSQHAKDSVMTAFAKNQLQILVATAVVEVGIDIQNANVMLIEGAERFGLAQLHQFRGRIGRNDKQATCYAIQTDSTKDINPRLRAFEKNKDGFALAQLDLELRGPGALFGTIQSGFIPLKMANIADATLLARAKKIVAALEELHP